VSRATPATVLATPTMDGHAHTTAAINGSASHVLASRPHPLQMATPTWVQATPITVLALPLPGLATPTPLQSLSLCPTPARMQLPSSTPSSGWWGMSPTVL
jgi:hypothetical protein